MSKSGSNMGYVIFLAVVAAIGGILFGYDTAVVSGTLSQISSQFALTEMQLGWFVGCALIGSIIGVSFAGTLSDTIGRKKTMLIAAITFFVSGIGCAACKGFTDLIVFRMIGGMGIGIVSIVSPLYISEISPASKRGTMVALYQLAVTVGFLLAYIVNYSILQNSSNVYPGFLNTLLSTEMWRGMLGSYSVVALIFIIVIFFVEESPRWLIVKGKDAEAMNVFAKLFGNKEDAVAEFGLTKSSISGEVKSEWKALLEPGILKAVIIGCCIAILGQFMGVNAVLYYGPAIFEKAGLGGGDAMFSQVLVGVVNMVTTIIAVFIIDKVGRKKLIYYGVSGMILCLLLIAVYFVFGTALNLSNTFLLVFFLLYVFCTAISICAVVFVILSEMYPNKVRGRAMSVAGLALWVGTYLIGQLTPWMLTNLTPGGTFLLFAAMCVPYMLIMWKLVPETTGKTLEEIEEYWKVKK